jgi:predicted CopG family antitoxin
MDTESKMDDYISVEAARKQLGISPREMFMLLEAEALRYRKDPYNETIRWVSAEDVGEAVEYLASYRQSERERKHQLFSIPEKESQTEAREMSYFTFSEADLTLLLWASVPYFDAERDIYFGGIDEHGSVLKTLSVVERLYSKLEKETKAGRSISEIVEEIAEQKPDQDTRNEVFQYLMRKARRERRSF